MSDIARIQKPEPVLIAGTAAANAAGAGTVKQADKELSTAKNADLTVGGKDLAK